jgi:cyclopropane-fatty-acyl-phospholipid synthase
LIVVLFLIVATIIMILLLSRHSVVPYPIQRYFVFQAISDSSLIEIHNEKALVNRVWTRGEVGLGESYVEGDWNSADLSTFLSDLIQKNRSSSLQKPSWWSKIIAQHFSPQQDKMNIEHHYDVGNDFYDIFLTDPFQAYSCAIWSSSTMTLAEAQKNKIDIIIRKMSLGKNKKDAKILDIGCGWGKIGDYVSRQTGARVTGVTLSEKQYESGHRLSTQNPRWTVKIKDYRDLSSEKATTYDAIYSIGMMEHVRVENYNTFFQVIQKILKPGGRMVLHTIIKGKEVDTSYQEIPSYVTAHIFPGGQIPCLGWMETEIIANGMQIEHVEYFGGQHYAETLFVWRQQLVARTPEILSWKDKKGQQKYPLQLIRSYLYYFTVCEMLFRNGELHTAHLIIVNAPILKLTVLPPRMQIG